VGVAGKAAVLACLAALLYFERKRPLRPPVDPGAARLARNLATGAITGAIVSAVERPIVNRLSLYTAAHKWGVVPRLGLPATIKTALAIALMDYTLYWWHVVLHRVPALWRLHEPHHIDRDLDTSTGIRFHFAEFLASIPWRCAQVLLIGVEPRALSLWQRLTLAEVLFHHANVRLPRRFERVLSRILVTPRLHGIHHSVLREERDTNFSSGLALWDHLHGSACARMDRDNVQIGLPGFERTPDVSLVKTLALPFMKTHDIRRHLPAA
jgi:sterol desaturase/sphingolipid hydroxylase (fatty acid hydroxylase superfamily)